MAVVALTLRPPFAFAARGSLAALFGRTARTPDLDHLGFGRLLFFRFGFGNSFGSRFRR